MKAAVHPFTSIQLMYDAFMQTKATYTSAKARSP